jgi:Lon protease-like protein
MELPDEVGIMVLPGLVFFPHNLAPLHIFEPRYRVMLAKALDSHRMFGICHGRSSSEPCEVGSVGIIRACVRNEDGTSNLILQGVHRVRFASFTQSRPYFVGVPVPLEKDCSSASVEEEALAAKVVEMASGQPSLQGNCRDEVSQFLASLTDIDMLVDIVAGNFVQCPEDKQQLLELEDRAARLRLLARILHQQRCAGPSA